MRPSKFTDDQIVEALRQVKTGMPATQVCRNLGITETPFRRWRNKYDGVAMSELRGLRDENRKLKEIVVSLLLDRQGSTDFRRKKIAGRCGSRQLVLPGSVLSEGTDDGCRVLRAVDWHILTSHLAP